MKIQFASDLHLEFPENKQYLNNHPLEPEGEILLLAGDIVPFGMMHHHKDFFKFLSDHFQKTYWIPGNHEYYHFDITEKPMILKEDIRTNVHLVNNISLQSGNTRFLFTTLWSKIHPDKQLIENRLTDFQLIKYGRFRLSIERYNELHHTCRDFLSAELDKEHSGETIIVSHHIPTFLHYPDEYKNSELNEAFAVELVDLIQEKQPDYWIYGHHHRNIPDFRIGKTRLITNQLGYIVLGENHDFDPARTFQINESANF